MAPLRAQRRSSLLGFCVSITLICGWGAACAPFSTRGEPLEYPEPEISERIAFANDVLTRVLAREYRYLEDLAREVRSGKTTFSNGEWKLRWFYLAFSLLGDSRSWYPVPLLGQNPEWNAVRACLEEWRDQIPNSVTARIALAQFWIAYAWDARGEEWAEEVRDEQWALFAERLNRSSEVLEQASRLEEKCPEWWFVAQRLALVEGWDRSRVDKLMEAAVAFEPEYHAYYSALAYHLFPRWHGKPGEWERELSQWAARLGSPRGEIAYARVLWGLRDLGFGDEIFKEYDIDWGLAERGLLALSEQYPDSFEIQSTFALLTVRAGDRPQARLRMHAIGNRMDRGVWRSEEQFRSCRDWALKP